MTRLKFSKDFEMLESSNPLEIEVVGLPPLPVDFDPLLGPYSVDFTPYRTISGGLRSSPGTISGGLHAFLQDHIWWTSILSWDHIRWTSLLLIGPYPVDFDPLLGPYPLDFTPSYRTISGGLRSSPGTISGGLHFFLQDHIQWTSILSWDHILDSSPLFHGYLETDDLLRVQL